MIENLIILGTSGNACDILDIVEAANAVKPTWNIIGFLDDGFLAGQRFARFPILGRLCEASRFDGCLFINAIGSDRSYRKRAEIIAATNLTAERFATLIHPRASVSRRARIGRGVYVNYGASIGGRVVIEDHASLGPGCIIGHDTHIEAYAVVAPGAVVSGAVRIGRSVYVGARAAIRQRLTIGEQALVGMGAVVVRDVEPGTIVVGNPARTLRRCSDDVEAAMADTAFPPTPAP